MDYLRDPAEICRRSFATIEAEADLARLPSGVRGLARRLIHACGMVDPIDDFAFSSDVATRGYEALKRGAPVIVDARMVAAGILARRLAPGSEIVCTLDDPSVPGLAEKLKTTRSAAAVDLWPPRLEGAVVAIGNAPTALVRLLELLNGGAARLPRRLRRRVRIQGRPRCRSARRALRGSARTAGLRARERRSDVLLRPVHVPVRAHGRAVPIRVVPGVSSLTACAAVLGAPLAARNDVLTVLPAPLDATMLRERLAGRARYVERATLDGQRALPLSEVASDSAPYFSMILVHKRGEAWP
jgi:precorrin isomerase